MLTPNKVNRFSESIIGKMTFILTEISKQEMTINELYLTTQHYFEEIDEFIYSIDVLYLLDTIHMDFDKGVIKYVNRNQK